MDEKEEEAHQQRYQDLLQARRHELGDRFDILSKQKAPTLQSLRGDFKSLQLNRQTQRTVPIAELGKGTNGLQKDTVVERLHQNVPEYRKRPQPIRAPMLIWVGDKPEDAVGSLFQPKAQQTHSYVLTWNFGDHADPCLRFSVTRSQDLSVPLVQVRDDKLVRAKFTWYPGVEVRLNNQSEDEMQLDNNESVSYQIGACGTFPIGKKKDYDDAVELGVYGEPEHEEPYYLSDDDMRRLVLLVFESNEAHVKVEKKQDLTTFSADNNPARDLEVFNGLLRDTPTVKVLFLMPEGRGSAKEFVSGIGSDYHFWEQQLQSRVHSRRPKQLDAYYDSDGNIAISPDMVTVDKFANRMHGQYDKAKQQQIAEAERSGQPFFPNPDSFYKYQPDITFPTVEQFAIPHMGVVVRQYQAEISEYALLSTVELEFSIFKATRSYHNKNKTKQQVKVENAYFVVLHPCEALRDRVPLEWSTWTFNWIVHWGGGVQQTEEHLRWNGVVRGMTPEEKTLTGGVALFVCTAPGGREAVRFDDVGSVWRHISQTNKKTAHIEQVYNKLPLERQLDAIRNFISPETPGLEEIRKCFVFRVDDHRGEPINLRTNSTDDLDQHDGKDQLWTQALGLIRSKLNADQYHILDSVCKSLPYPLHCIFGGFGCRKTTTIAMVTVLLCMVGHKVVVSATDHGCLDWFITKLEQCRLELAQAYQTQFQDGSTRSFLRKLKFLRFLPPAVESGMARNDMEGVRKLASNNGTMQFGKIDEEDRKHDTKVQELFSAIAFEQTRQMDNIEAESAEDATSAADRAEASRNRVHDLQDRLDDLKLQYDRVAGKAKEFTYPASCSMAYHISQYVNRVDDLNPDLQHITKDFRTAHQNYNDMNANMDTSKADRKRILKALQAATDDIMTEVLGAADVVAATYVNANHPLVTGAFKPTLAFHEECSKTTMGQAIGLTVFNTIKTHLFVGDPKQLLPAAKGNVGEFQPYAKQSVPSVLVQKGLGVNWVSEQSRMAPTLSEFPSRKFYGGRITDAPEVVEDTPSRVAFREAVASHFGVDHLLVGDHQFVAVNVPNSVAMVGDGNTSLENWGSADAIADFVYALLTGNFTTPVVPDDVLVLCFYKKQCYRIKQALSQKGIRVKDVITVDASQGKDAKYVVLDVVSTSHGPQLLDLLKLAGKEEEATYATISGYMLDQSRWCVALSRAMDGMAMFWNADTLSNALSSRAQWRDRDGDAHILHSLLQEVWDRDIGLWDSRMDSNPVFRGKKMSEAEWEAHLLKMRDRTWNSVRREEKVFQRKFKQRTTAGSISIFTGKDALSPFGVLPSTQHAAARENAQRPGVRVARQDPQARAKASGLSHLPDVAPPKKKKRGKKGKGGRGGG